MGEEKANRLTREDWSTAALRLLRETGIDGVKVAPLAARIGVTTGSFYWHFKNRRELLDTLLDYWEREMTDAAIEAARQFKGPPKDRILHLMKQVMADDLARYDLAIWNWSHMDALAEETFERTISKRFAFATWMFMEAGFQRKQAQVRGRMMVVYMMGESTLIPDSMAKRLELIKLNHAILTAL